MELQEALRKIHQADMFISPEAIELLKNAADLEGLAGKLLLGTDFVITPETVERLNRQAEEKELADHPDPTGWDKYGGSKDGPALKATGFFYPAKHDGKWWLVTPGGHLFFSRGEGKKIMEKISWKSSFITFLCSLVVFIFTMKFLSVWFFISYPL